MLELYPGAREVMLVRDFRDMIASMFAYNEKRGRQGFRRDRAASDRDYILNDVGVSVGGAGRRLGQALGHGPPAPLRGPRPAPEETVQALLAHLGLDAGPGAVEPMLGSLLARDSGSEGHRTVPDPRESIGRWRHDLSDEVAGGLRRGPRPASGDLRVRAGVSGETVLVGGSVAQRPGSGGHTWVFLQYLLGLRRLGLEPVLVGPARAGDVPSTGRAAERRRALVEHRLSGRRDGPLRPGRPLGACSTRAAGPCWG